MQPNFPVFPIYYGKILLYSRKLSFNFLDQLLKRLHSCHNFNICKFMINRITLFQKLFDLFILIFAFQKRIAISLKSLAESLSRPLQVNNRTQLLNILLILLLNRKTCAKRNHFSFLIFNQSFHSHRFQSTVIWLSKFL